MRRKKIIIGVFLAAFLLLITPIISAVKTDVVKNNFQIRENQKNLISNKINKKEIFSQDKNINIISKNIILIEKLEKRYDLGEKDISLNEITAIKTDLELIFNHLKEFIQKNDLTDEKEITSNVNKIENRLNELDQLIENNPEQLGIIIQGFRYIIAYYLFCNLLVFDFVYILLLFVIIPISFIEYYVIELIFSIAGYEENKDERWRLYKRIVFFPYVLTIMCGIVLSTNGKISFFYLLINIFFPDDNR